VRLAVCEFCGGAEWNSHTAREMMFGLQRAFTYRECRTCGVLRLADAPTDMAAYYPETYYSLQFEVRPTGAIRQLFYRAHLAWPRLMRNLYPCGAPLAGFAAVRRKKCCKVLDVGSGTGELVGALRDVGIDALGIDPYIPADVHDHNGVRVRRCDLQMQGASGGAWDIIMFHHSLEHMPDHVEVLRCVKGLLAADGVCLVRMPVAGWTWRQYRTDWVQLDAPRHLIVHTQESFRLAAHRAGMNVTKVIFDSRDFQFWGSELYRRNIPLFCNGSLRSGRDYFSSWQMASFRRRAKHLNRMRDGDQAVFVLERAN
jgi:SAM-dependent methyltransferase